MAGKTVYDFTAESLEGRSVPLSKYRGKHHRLNAMMEMFGGLQFTVLGFCCNQFGLQSPEVNSETLNLLKYVRPGGGFVPKFPVFGKVEVNGLNEEPLFTYLKECLPFVNPVIGDMNKFYWSPISVNDIRWNFEKFLIAADGVPLKREPPQAQEPTWPVKRSTTLLQKVSKADLYRSVNTGHHRLNAMMEMFGGLQFTVLGFCCNQFGLQSPEVNSETLNLLKYVRPGGGFVPKFPVFGKVEVNGLNEEPLFTYLKECLPFVNPVIGDMNKFYWSPISVNDIRWNFEKFLIAADGVPLKRYELHCPIAQRWVRRALTQGRVSGVSALLSARRA
ncbi:hypothetical protein CRUP_038855, partial [Coryphaenoides rupestris]